MIQELACGCNRDRKLLQLVCNAADKGSEISGSQVHGEAQRTEEQPYGIPDKEVPERWDVVGLGQAMVDFSGTVGDDFLEELGLVKGTRKVVGHEERGKVLRALDGRHYKLSAGGSLSNTLVALARLGFGSSQNSAQNVAMTGSVGSDALGDFYRTKLLRANVHFLSQPVVEGTTGTVIVLTTPDAQRTMLSYQGMSSIVNFDSALANAISKSRVLVVEGYLWEINQTIEAIAQACEAARQQGVLVALTASDVSCVTRHRQQFWDVMCQSTDILFANADEARALCAFGDDSTPEQATKHLNQFCPLVSVTDGPRGSYIGLRGEVVFIPPAPCVPVDTCGAGDAYAAGVLYGLLRGVPDVKGMGDLAARVAAVVVGQQGTRLKEEAALELAESVNSLSDLLDSRIMELMGMKDEVVSERISSV
jgi:sugar/nucleoside kinase (ribokinase family)